MQDKLITLSFPSTGLEDFIKKANDLIRAAKAPSARKAYQSDFRIYDSWCTVHGLSSLPSAPGNHRALHRVLRGRPSGACDDRETSRIHIESPPGGSIRRSSRVNQALCGRRGFEGCPPYPGRRAEMKRSASVARHPPPSCRVPEESTRPSRSRINPDGIRGRVLSLGTLCDGGI